jgi:thioredoxin 1
MRMMFLTRGRGRSAGRAVLPGAILIAGGVLLDVACSDHRAPEAKTDVAAPVAGPSAQPGKVLQFTDANFDAEVLKSREPVLVDFTAVWCGPCRALAPIVEELAKSYSGRARVGKLDVDKNPRTAAAYRISSIPAVLLFKDGKQVGSVIGLNPKSEYQRLLDRHAGAGGPAAGQ